MVFDSQTRDGVPVRALASTVPNTGWKVLISIPTAEIRRVPIEAAALLAGIMSVLLVLALAAGRWFSNRATAPIEYLGRCADRLGSGEEVAYQPHGLEEIDNVARRMAEASKQIRRSQRELEQRVNEAIRATEQAQGALAEKPAPRVARTPDGRHRPRIQQPAANPHHRAATGRDAGQGSETARPDRYLQAHRRARHQAHRPARRLRPGAGRDAC
jgi:hypothetical protein